MAHKAIEIPKEWFREDTRVGERPRVGSPAAILAVMKGLPLLDPGAVDELEAAIRLGRMAPRFNSEFD